MFRATQDRVAGEGRLGAPAALLRWGGDLQRLLRGDDQGRDILLELKALSPKP